MRLLMVGKVQIRNKVIFEGKHKRVPIDVRIGNGKLIDLSHTIEHGLVTYKGLPAPIIVEHLCNLGQLPDEGFTFSALPPKFKGVGTFPVRALAKLR